MPPKQSTRDSWGTFPEGTVRFSLSYFNRQEEIDEALAAVMELAQGEFSKHG